MGVFIFGLVLDISVFMVFLLDKLKLAKGLSLFGILYFTYTMIYIGFFAYIDSFFVGILFFVFAVASLIGCAFFRWMSKQDLSKTNDDIKDRDEPEFFNNQTTSSPSKYCPSCGKTVPLGTNFCDKCGYSFSGVANYQRNVQSVVYSAEPSINNSINLNLPSNELVDMRSQSIKIGTFSAHGNKDDFVVSIFSNSQYDFHVCGGDIVSHGVNGKMERYAR